MQPKFHSIQKEQNISATHVPFKKMTELSSQEATLTQQFLSMMRMVGKKICQTLSSEEWVMLVQALYPEERKYV